MNAIWQESGAGKARVDLFGQVRCETSGGAVRMPQKFFPLLAILATDQSSGGVQRSTLIEYLWGDVDQKKADANFRQLLARIKAKEKSVGGWLVAVNCGRVVYNSDLVEVDLRVLLSPEFHNGLRQGDDGCLTRLSKVCRDDLIKDIPIDTPLFASWRAEIDVRLSKAMTAALVALLDDEMAVGSLHRRRAVAEHLLMFDPSQELAYRTLIEYYHQTGDAYQARCTYDDCIRVLRESYGVEPELSTVQLAANLGIVRPYPHKPTSQGGLPSTAAEAGIDVRPGDGNVWHIGNPRVILLPPQLVGAHADSTTVIDVLLDDVTAGLTRYRSMSVVAAHTGREVVRRNIFDVQELHEKYGVHYAVKTSVKPAASGNIVTLILLDCRTSECLAALDAQFSEDNLLGLFQRLGNEIIRRFVSAIERREVDFPTAASSKTAYRHFLEGRKSLWHSDLPDLRRARTKFNKSIIASSTFAPAHAGMARTLSMEKLVRGLTENELLIESLEFAERSIKLDPQDGRGLRERGFTSLYLRRHDESLSCFNNAEVLNPNDADMLADYADALTHSGIPDQALVKCLRAKALNPEYPDYYDWIHASILYQTEEYQEAMALLMPLGENPAVARLLAASAAMSGNGEVAAHFAKIFRESYPEFHADSLTDIVPDKHAQDTRHLLEGLHLAGIR